MALVVTPSEASLYLDDGAGLKSAKNAITHGTLPLEGPLVIGHDQIGPQSSRHWGGAIDDVRVWKQALPPEEIQAAVTTAPAADEPSLLAWWNFDETIAGEAEVLLFAEPVLSMLTDSTGGFWIGTPTGVILFPSGVEAGEKARRFTFEDGLAKGPVLDIFEAVDGAVWIGTLNSGVSRMDRKSTNGAADMEGPQPAFTTFTTADGLGKNQISRISQDNEGNMWFAGGTNEEDGSASLSRFNGESFVNFGRADGLAGGGVPNIHFDPHGGLWAGTPFGVSHLDDRSVTVLGESEGLDPGQIADIVSTRDGNVWLRVVSDSAKLSRFDGKHLVKLTREDGLPGAKQSALYLDHDGALLVGDWNRGTARFDPAAAGGERPPLRTAGGIRANRHAGAFDDG